jgi:hypothetical protein
MEDSLIWLETTCSLRQEMDYHHKNGSSTKRLELSDLREPKATHGQFKAVETVLISKQVVQTQNGINFSSGTREKETSSMLRTRKFSMLLEEKMKKLPTFKFGRRTALKPNLGNLSIRVISRSRPKD